MVNSFVHVAGAALDHFYKKRIYPIYKYTHIKPTKNQTN